EFRRVLFRSFHLFGMLPDRDLAWAPRPRSRVKTRFRDCVHCGADPPVRGRPPGRPARLDEIDPAGEERVQGDPRGPGDPPHNFCTILRLRTGRTSGVTAKARPT